MSSVAQEFVKIGAVKVPIEKAKNPELVPTGFGFLQILFTYQFSSNCEPTKFLGSNIEMDAAKEFTTSGCFSHGKSRLSQEQHCFPISGLFLIHSIYLNLQELCNREFEYIAITRDTTEADIKQRREIRSGSAFYTDLVCKGC